MKIALTIVLGGFMHLSLHDAFQVCDRTVEFILARFNADNCVLCAAELDACPRTSPDTSLVKPVICHQILSNQIFDHSHHGWNADVQSLGKARR